MADVPWATGHVNTRPNNPNHLSTPIPNPMGVTTPVFFLSEAEVHQLISNQTNGRIGNRINNTLGNSGTATWYWLRSSGNPANHTAVVNATGHWHAGHAGGNGVIHAFRPAIWVRRELDTDVTSPADEYAITFNPTGGTFNQTSVIVPTGEDHEITSELPERDGFVFIGWSRTEAGDNEGAPEYMILPPEASNTEGNRHASVVENVQSDITLYAIWREIVDIRVNNAGWNPVNTFTSRIGAIETLSANLIVGNPAQASTHHFLMWLAQWESNADTALISEQINPTYPRRSLETQLLVSANDLLITPIFATIDYEITFDSNGLGWTHTIPVFPTLESRNEYIIMNPTDMYRPGIPFIGWRTPEGEIIEQQQDTHLVSVEALLAGENQVTLTAVWYGEDDAGLVELTFPESVVPEEVAACSASSNDSYNGTNSPAFWQDPVTGMHWCVAATQGDHVMLVSRFALRFNSPGAPEGAGTAANNIPPFTNGNIGQVGTQFHSTVAFQVWGAPTPTENLEDAITNATTSNTQYGTAIRGRVNNWFRDTQFVSLALRNRTVHTNIPLHSIYHPEWDINHERWTETTHISTPMNGAVPGQGLPFFLGPADLNVRFGTELIDRQAFSPNGAQTWYWLRSSGFSTGPQLLNFASHVSGNGDWGTSVTFSPVHAFRPAIWVRR